MEVFEKSGFIAKNDLQDVNFRNSFIELEKEHLLFKNKEHLFRSKEYKWPRDPLHTWSRMYEYPYSYYHIKKLIPKMERSERPIIVDFGSGVTFFPFSIQKLGANVICTDIDPIAKIDIEKAIEVFELKENDVSFRLISGKKVPFEDEEVDCVYCISVIEHIPDFLNTLKEIKRILIKNGYFILTCDVDLSFNGTELGVKDFRKLNKYLSSNFDFVYPNVLTHPTDILTSKNGQYPIHCLTNTQETIFMTKNLIKRIIGRQISYGSELTFCCWVLRKKE